MNASLLNGEQIAIISTTPSAQTPIRVWVLVQMYRIGQCKDTTDNTIFEYEYEIQKQKNGTTNTTINYIKLNLDRATINKHFSSNL